MKDIPNILIICGPTSSGKTSLALSIAKLIISSSSLRGRLGDRGNPVLGTQVHILSADSRQIYQGLDIVTGKDIPSDLSPLIKIFGVDLVEANKKFNLSDFVQYADDVIQKSLEDHTPLIIVGGTGLYLQAITSNLLNVHVPPDEKLRRQLEKQDVPTLQKRLQVINPKRFASLNNSDVNNPRRLIRAIEIFSSLSRSSVGAIHESPTNEAPFLSSSRMRGSISPIQPIFHWVGLRPNKETLAKKIRQRVRERLESGAIKEVQSLRNKHSAQNHPIFSSLGVKQITEYLNKNISREELIDRWTSSEIDYARRQMVWFKKQSGIIWYDNSEVNQDLVSKLSKIIK